MIVAIILARSNSKGIPHKNLRKVGGVSLVGRAILAAQKSEIFDRIIVSTDGDDIRIEAQSYNCEVVMRPIELADDKTTSINSMIYTIKKLRIFDGICFLLQPTSPLRTSNDILNAYSIFKKQMQGCLVSVTSCRQHPYKCIVENIHGVFNAVSEINFLEAPRQTLPVAYHPNGAIYINFINDILNYSRFFIEPISIYKMSKNSSIDIDTIQDLQIANEIITKDGKRYE
ncbi:acylneuraminate cytidylyltransferase family protein [Campylobacter concisus]|jgi:N-acylneuraminate cytidylyltransferase